MRILTLYLLIVLSLQTSFAQQHLVDSLLEQLNNPLPDTTRALSMMRLAVDYELVDTAKAFQAYREAIKFSKSKELDFFLGRTYLNQAYLLKVAGKKSEAIAVLDSAIHFLQLVNTSRARKYEANAISDKANNYRELNETDLAVENYLRGIAMNEKFNFNDQAALGYYNIAIFFSDMGEHDKQLQYAQRALATAKRWNLNVRLQAAYFSVAFAYSTLNNNELAKVYLDSSKITFNESSNVELMVSYYLISGQVYRKLNSLDSSFYFFEKCLEISTQRNYGYGIAESKIEMGAVALLQKKYTIAERYLREGIMLGETLHVNYMLDDAYKYLSDAYASMGQYKQAYEAHLQYKTLNDSVLNENTRKNVLELEKKYETAKKDAQLKLQQAQLQQKDIINYILIGGAITLVIILLLSYRTYSQKRKLQQQRINELEVEKQLTATEAVLKGEEMERTRIAKDLHDGLGGMLSGIKYSLHTMKGNLIMTPENAQAFERSMDMLDSSISEMRRVAHNMMPEALVKFGLDTALRDYCNDINQSGAIKVSYQSIGLQNATIEQTAAITIYRIIQELVTNVVRHAHAGSAIVQITKIDSLISVTVEDDGRGFDTVILRKSTGIGWSNIHNRIEFLKGKVDVNSEPGKGTSVLIEFLI